MIIVHLLLFVCELSVYFLPTFLLGYCLWLVWICKYSIGIVTFCLLLMLHFLGSLFLFLPLLIVFVNEVLSIYVVKSILTNLYIYFPFQWMKE